MNPSLSSILQNINVWLLANPMPFHEESVITNFPMSRMNWPLSWVGSKCLLSFFFFFVCFAISWAAPAAYGGSQARGRIGAVAAGLCTPEPQQHGIRAASVTYTTAHGNAGSLTH